MRKIRYDFDGNDKGEELVKKVATEVGLWELVNRRNSIVTNLNSVSETLAIECKK